MQKGFKTLFIYISFKTKSYICCLVQNWEKFSLSQEFAVIAEFRFADAFFLGANTVELCFVAVMGMIFHNRRTYTGVLSGDAIFRIDC